MESSSDPPPDQGPPPAEPEPHPAAALFPLMDVDGAEFGELVGDIRAHGLLQPIVLHEGTSSATSHRYRLALAETAVQASHIVQFDAEEAAQVVDENLAVVLISAAST
jgi:hypothetical protein